MAGDREQVVDSKLGEIRFRRRLKEQQVEGKRVFKDEFDAGGIQQILRDRMEKTRMQIGGLRDRGIPISPYLEIGAERCQRSLVMENDLGAAGAAADISFDSLQSCVHYGKVFGKPCSPARLCCDAYHLPFLAGSLPFVFCYETLHHFPDPTPIIREIFRIVSPGGRFMFEEEPFKRVLHVDLYKGRKLYSKENLRSGRLRRALDATFGTMSCNEVEHGVIENFGIPLSVWKEALSGFEDRRVTLHSVKTTGLFEPRNRLFYLLAYLFGGGISGLCRKPGKGGPAGGSVLERLACPTCLEEGKENRLAPADGPFHCAACGRNYPVEDGIIFLLSDRCFRQLYPEIFEGMK